MIALLARYWFLLTTLAGLVAGFIVPASASWVPWLASAAIGLGLSGKWLIDAIREKTFGSDVLAVLSIVATALISEWLAAAVISLMLASGRALETWAEGRAHSKLEALLKRAPQNAHLLDLQGNLNTTAIGDVPIGSRILVKSGEVVPLDGTLLTNGTFDESALTGEPLPVFHEVSVEVPSGVVNTGGSVELVTTQDSQSSTYSGLIRLVQQAQAESANAVRIANRWAVRFIPFAMGLAGATWLITQDVNKAVAVIVAATPCPLILAVPVAIIAGMSKATSKGAIIKGGAALEQLARTKVILLDKTGTLTHGGPAVSSAWFAPGTDEGRVLQLAASLEQASPHVVAKSVIAYGALHGVSLLKPEAVTETHGVGLTGTVAGVKVFVGQPTEKLPAWCQASESLLIAVVIDGKFKAVLGLDDPVRAESAETIRGLRSLGVDRIILVSGDRRTTVEAVSTEVGADAFFAECSPAHKMEILHAEQQLLDSTKTGGIVVVVGDGINDAPALAAAGVGVAMGARGATAASEAADVVIIEDSIANLAMAVDVAQGARARALQASGFGMALAVAAMFLGSFGVLDATGAALSQEVIDAAAILWALVPARSRLRAL